MFSLNYYKGFSVFRTFNLDETALIICNMAYKLEKENTTVKRGFYTNIKNKSNNEVENIQNANNTENIIQKGGDDENEIETSEKDYVNVIKKVKKDNVTVDNIDEIMLCQIPGISSVSALAIIKKFNTLTNLIKELEVNSDCLKDISYTNTKGQIRKINKTCITNIVKYLLKK